MEFFYDLYNSENFVIYLFITIAVLTAIFLILIFSGRKTDKKNHKNEIDKATDNIDTTTGTTINNVVLNSNVDVPAIVPPVVETPVEAQLNPEVPAIVNPIVETPVAQLNENVEIPVPQEPIVPVDPFNKTINDIEFTPVKEEQTIAVEQPEVSAPVIAEPVVQEPVLMENEQPSVNITPVLEQPVITPEPIAQAVELNPIETPVFNIPEAPIVQEPVISSEPIIPVETPTIAEPIIKTEPLIEEPVAPVNVAPEPVITDDDLPKLKEEVSNPLDVNETYRI